MTEFLMMTLTPQLRKIAIKKRASHPSSIREPDLDFRKLVNKLEQAEITMKLEETENLKLQYVNRIETNTTHINNIQESDTDLSEKITEILNIYEKQPNFKVKPSFKNGVIVADNTDTIFPNVDKNSKTIRINLKSIKNQINRSINLRKKMKISQTKEYIVITVQENHFRTTPITQGINLHISQVIEDDHQNEEIHKILHKIIIIDQIVKKTIRDQIAMQQNSFLDPVPNQTQEINTIPIINHETHHTTETETIHIIEKEVIRTIEIRIT